MATVYKLTKEDNNSAKGSLGAWGIAASYSVDPATLTSEPLCTTSWIHVYKSAQLAHFLNPAHLNLSSFRIWEATGTIGKSKQQTKHGCRSLTTNSEVLLVFPTDLQRQKFAVLCYQATLGEPAAAAPNPGARWSPTAVIAGTQDPLNTAIYINSLYDGMIANAQQAALAAQAGAKAALAAAIFVDDATARNTALFAVQAADRAIGALAANTAYDQIMTLVAEAGRRVIDATDDIMAAAVPLGKDQHTLVKSASDSAAIALRDLTPALHSVVAMFAAKASLSTDSSGIAALSAKTAVLAGEAADAAGTTIDFVAIATQAMS